MSDLDGYLYYEVEPPLVGGDPDLERHTRIKIDLREGLYYRLRDAAALGISVLEARVKALEEARTQLAPRRKPGFGEAETPKVKARVGDIELDVADVHAVILHTRQKITDYKAAFDAATTQLADEGAA